MSRGIGDFPFVPGADAFGTEPRIYETSSPSFPVADRPPYVGKLKMDSDTFKIRDAIQQLLSVIDPQLAAGEQVRPGIQETPMRAAKAWQEWTSGYEVNIAGIFKAFADGAENVDEMVLVKDIPFYSHCEHHLAPIFGTCTIGYVPNGTVVGLSKLSRLTDAFARRLQVQERMTTQIADALMEHLKPLGCGVVVRARHLCMESRGVCQQGHHTLTSALRGVIRTESDARREFFTLAK